MNYELIERAGHVCNLPDVSEFNDGDVIRCTDTVLSWGREVQCQRYWERYSTFWKGVPSWRPWAAGW